MVRMRFLCWRLGGGRPVSTSKLLSAILHRSHNKLSCLRLSCCKRNLALTRLRWRRWMLATRSEIKSSLWQIRIGSLKHRCKRGSGIFSCAYETMVVPEGRWFAETYLSSVMWSRPQCVRNRRIFVESSPKVCTLLGVSLSSVSMPTPHFTAAWVLTVMVNVPVIVCFSHTSFILFVAQRIPLICAIYPLVVKISILPLSLLWVVEIMSCLSIHALCLHLFCQYIVMKCSVLWGLARWCHPLLYSCTILCHMLYLGLVHMAYNVGHSVFTVDFRVFLGALCV